MKLHLENIIKDNLISYDNDYPDNRLFWIYQDLVLSIFHSRNKVEAFEKLLVAIKRPILSIEVNNYNLLTYKING